ncbi:ribonucleoside-diphosphate reductase subunit alpha [Conexibacter sp. JD483]|uniref:ribonucleoside-diphosphate reductase subunit alpha n=1 Tax=unclassified Conexibacter TaxID=2627773 RepID=UPI00271D56E5|nr:MULTISPECIES: ribonucleoside-diphosphate reductase subunit alpha [unclassified Conexibacter]MDO8187596.1 ribonucleoside-diphosphate reductase subunit alpha [Conexibacter sp. CPCC 205706]MDO8201072.1 ribonucleoside-diphosphate reductase subunit alpha [Conexibacter sp. CPCC 205762]MDR9371823.1 ribonucleoside-diphosphate reductase subunit alpha [Conexibacter sp. JD483]
MLIEFDEILRDLELKRAAALPGDESPAVDVAAALAELDDAAPLDLVVVDDDGGERPFAPALAAALVADALATLALAHGEASADTAAGRALVRATTTAVIARLEGTARVTHADLSTVVEAALIDAGHYELAKALVLRRAQPTATAARATGTLRLIRRSGEVASWETAKIEVAIRKAFLSREADSEPAVRLAARVSERAHALGLAYVPIETVQDIVQEELVLAGHMRVAERYIVYRAERALLRAQQSGAGDDGGRGGEGAAALPAVPVLEADGGETSWDGADLRARIAFASIGLELESDAAELERELRRAIRPGIARADLRKLIVLNARALVERDSDYSRFAGRILLSFVYEEALDWSIERDGVSALKAAHERALRPLLEHGVTIRRIDPRLLAYELDRLAAALDPSADLDFDFLGLQTLYDRYLLIDKTGVAPRRIEAPQLFWLRVAMGVCLGERDDDPVAREQRAIDLYTVYKQRRFCSSTPTLFNAGTPHSQLSSCFVYKIDDTLSSIVGRGIAENAMCSKWAGGLGGSWTAVRGTGSHIESTNGESQGVVPFLKMHNDQLVAVNQGGKRAGSGCAYLEVWHNDIREFLELRRNTGDERRRTHDMNTACWIPDLFLQRVEARGQWTLFRSNDVPDLHESYGADFKARYEAYEARVDAGELHGERIPALELWKQMLKLLFETGHPWLTFKDPCNVRSPQDHAGVVHSSNLCTEITLNTGPDETAVCNLGSIVVDQHLTAAGEIDHDKLRETVRVAVRALDDVIDINLYPTEPTRTANSRHRPVGLGMMGLQYALYRKGLAFGSDEAVAFGDELTEAIAFYAYEASSDLAAERGTYQSYAGSKWDRGLLPQDTVELLEQERGESVEVARGGVMDWAPLREKIAAQGMRNSNVMAIAPTATIANIMGTSPCIEPMYKNLFAKSNLSGDFVVLNPFLVRDLKAAGQWSRALAERLKAVDGDLEQVPEIPAALRALYRTAFQIEPERLIDAAARRQKWIDQSQSLNLFLAAPDMKAMSHMYRRAWRAGLKTTYYLRTLGASAIEKATVAAPALAEAPVQDAAALACSIEAMRNGEECEACQ